jgi:hypothetical protein
LRCSSAAKTAGETVSRKTAIKAARIISPVPGLQALA